MPADQITATELDDDADYGDPDLVGYQDRLRSLRDAKGVARVRLGSMTGLMLLRYADVKTAFFDDARYSKSAVLRPATFPLMGPNIQGYDGEEHRVKRGLVSRAFRPGVVRDSINPLLRPTAEELIDELAPLGEMDLMASFAKKYPLRIITRMLGIPREDEDLMAGWAYDMLRMSRDPGAAKRANEAFTRYVAPLVEKRRVDPGDDLLSTIVTEEIDGQRLCDEEVYGFLRLLFPAGVDTTWLTLGTLMVAVLGRPEVHQRLIDNEEDREKAIEETVRWESTTGTEVRQTLSDVVIAGVEVPAGAQLWLAVPVANRDPEVFENPDIWDIDRPAIPHLGFGLGTHVCLGARLARAELKIGLETLLRRLPNLRMVETPPIQGTTLRGPKSLQLAWDSSR